ncbi:MAG: hypothetical protein HY279_12210 [Nitrospinae bacterium]|nr:hypothetical protein [Nitrospinota bacterium]
MDNYIVRIYRRDRENPHKVAGLVEVVETGMKRVFTSFDELCEIFNDNQGEQTGCKRIRKKGGL